MIDRGVSEILSTAREAQKPALSLEFFPPKNEAAAADLLANAEAIATHVHPDFVSITYGAGGSTRQNTFLYGQLLRERFDWTVMPHLTCVGHTREELLAIAESYARIGIRSLMALRGDAPKTSTAASPSALCHASDLVALLHKELPEFCLGVAGYPEKHPEAPTLEADIAHLKTKLDSGAHFITTQMFFDVERYPQFMGKCRAAGITCPILPGLLPILSLKQARNFCAFCQTTLPKELERQLKQTAEADQWEVGVDWALGQIEGLLKIGAPGVHLYILNRSQSLLRLLEGLRQRRLFR